MLVLIAYRIPVYPLKLMHVNYVIIVMIAKRSYVIITDTYTTPQKVHNHHHSFKTADLFYFILASLEACLAGPVDCPTPQYFPVVLFCTKPSTTVLPPSPPVYFTPACFSSAISPSVASSAASSTAFSATSSPS